MKVNIVYPFGTTYIPNWLPNADQHYYTLVNEIAWEKRDDAPRFECWMVNRHLRELLVPYTITEQDNYTYGRGKGERTYQAVEMHPLVKLIQEWMLFDDRIEPRFLQGCFANRYDGERQHLGWHADDSPMINHEKPIAIVSLGEERLIEFKANGSEETKPLLLGHGSLTLMPPGFQHTHQHRIPKGNKQMGRRISLTFRGLI